MHDSTFSGKGNREWRIKIVYTYKVEEREYKGWNIAFGYNFFHSHTKEMFELEDAFKNNQRIAIWYNPERPNDSVIFPGSAGKLQWYIIGVAVVASTLAVSLLTQLFQ